MEGYEPFLTIPMLAKRSGFSETQLRVWCRRGNDPLPHVDMGQGRHIYKVRWSSFLDWIDKEQHRCQKLEPNARNGNREQTA